MLARLVEPHTRPRGSFEAGVLEAVQRFKASRSAGIVEPAALAAHLAALGYTARAVQSARSSVALSLKHTFVAVDADEGGAVAIVEPQLRSHFQISRPSPLYCRLVDELPDEFVGDTEQLSRLCYFMSEQMSACFALNSMATPPWRNVHSLLTKWNAGSERGSSPERAPLRPPTFRRRYSTDAERAEQCTAAVVIPWVSR